MVTAFFERLGNVGVLLIAGALLLGGLAGGAIVHQYERTSTRSVASQHQDGKDQDENKQSDKNGQDKQKNKKQQKQQKQQKEQKQHKSDSAGQAETD